MIGVWSVDAVDESVEYLEDKYTWICGNMISLINYKTVADKRKREVMDGKIAREYSMALTTLFY